MNEQKGSFNEKSKKETRVKDQVGKTCGKPKILNDHEIYTICCLLLSSVTDQNHMHKQLVRYQFLQQKLNGF